MIQAKIVLDSINPAGVRITTWLLTYPRFIHSEFMTHRVFSRNSSSSRAIPIAKMIESIERDTAQPELWSRNQKGMTGNEECADPSLARDMWLNFGNEAISFVKEYIDATDVHKAIANRILEPWAHMTVLATATDHGNFFKLRAHPAAQPEFQVLAYRMLDLYLKSTPGMINWGDWHMPGVSAEHRQEMGDSDSLKMATALACRASYSAFEGGLCVADAFRIHDQSCSNGHWSPFEHCAKAVAEDQYARSNYDGSVIAVLDRRPFAEIRYQGLSHWLQYRKLFFSEDTHGLSEGSLQSMLDRKPEWIKL